jgi:hypothetical protein
MAENIEQKTIDIIQTLIRDAFDMNSTLDRIKSVLTTDLAFPITANLVHMLAHKYPIQIADTLGDIIENRNQPVNYGGIPTHVEDYLSVEDAITKVHDSVIVYQNELNKGAKDILMETLDMDAYNGVVGVINEHKRYVDQVIQWKDIIDRYGNDQSLDVHMADYDMLGLGE